MPQLDASLSVESLRQDSLPSNVSVGEPIRLCVRADMLPDGSFGAQWLVITPDRVRVYASLDGGEPAERVALPLREIKSPKAESLVGGGVLEVTHGEETIELARYTNARAARFAFAARALERWAKGEEL
ncbi:MAG: hypothetical protein FJ279_28065, partial [Planctomycetes bacterium]|nr:hypothetical protein [Planctomycetota bacterium]